MATSITNTSISTDTINVDNGVLYVDNVNNRVGIGITTPDSLVHLSSTSGDTILTLEADPTDTVEHDNPQIHFLTDGGLRTAAITGGNATNEGAGINANALNLQSQNIRFLTSSDQDFNNATEKMRIHSAGDVEIGNYFRWITTGNYAQGTLRLGSGTVTSTSPKLWVTRNYGDITNPLVEFDAQTNDGRVLRVKSNTARTDMEIMDVVNSTGKVFGVRGDGIVTKPYHPAFDVTQPNGRTGDLTYSVVKLNNTNSYSQSNGRFTAPVTGTYVFFWCCIKNNINGTVTRLYIKKNGNIEYGSRHLRMDSAQDYGDNGTMQAIMQLNAGDYVQINCGAGEVYNSTEEYTHFGGYLLG